MLFLTSYKCKCLWTFETESQLEMENAILEHRKYCSSRTKPFLRDRLLARSCRSCTYVLERAGHYGY